MSRNMQIPQGCFAEGHKNTMDGYNMSPNEVQDGYQFGWKYIAIVNGDLFSVFRGFTNWDDDFVRAHGDRVYDAKLARLLFPVLVNKTFYS